MYSVSFDLLKEFVYKKLEGLDPDLTYHDKNHTIDVLAQCERIAKAEGVEDEKDLYLLKVAALYHDTGFLRVYKKHEEAGCGIFLEDAADFDFTEEEKQRITSLIMATKLPQMPVTIFEKIICDADLDYLGRDDFFKIGNDLRREFLKHDIIKSDEEWHRLQINFLTAHHYHTETSRNEREEAKQANIAKLL